MMSISRKQRDDTNASKKLHRFSGVYGTFVLDSVKKRAKVPAMTIV